MGISNQIEKSKIMRAEIIEYIVELIEQHGKLPAEVNPEEFNYIDTGYIDSIAIMKFMIELERRFEISLTPQDMVRDDFRTVEGLCDIIMKKMEKNR